ncbi:MAG: lipopolysaccharide biosynthesis protein [Oscillospiraceae bacterium]|nr:lipopolysaccharide biosynthesis protein [Oscillospiraceae bacterium]
MSNDSIKRKTISSMLWRWGESSLSQVVNFVVSVILARMLLPEDYGVVALVMVFITLCDKLVVSGLATSLIQKKDADNVDFSTIFFFSLGVATLLYTLLFAFSPLIADFFGTYDKALLVPVIRVMGIQVILVAASSVQSAYVSRTMQFRRFFWSTLGGIVSSAAVGICMAYAGYGVWALVAQNLIKMIGSMSVLWFTVKWRPQLVFSVERFKALYEYGWKIFAASVIKTLYNDLRSLVIGKFYSAADLAFYNKGQSFPQLVDGNIVGTIDSVFFSAIAKKQSSKAEMLSMLRRAVKVGTYVLTPLLVGLAAVAEPLVEVLLGEKWLPCVFYMQVLSISFVFTPIEIENLQTIKAVGRSDLVLKLEIVKKTVGVVLLIIAVPIGVEAIAISMLAGNVFAAAANAWPNCKLVGYGYWQQMMDVLPSLLMSAVMYGAVFAVPQINLPAITLLAVEVLVGVVVYVLLSVLTRNESFWYILNICKGFLKKRA